MKAEKLMELDDVYAVSCLAHEPRSACMRVRMPACLHACVPRGFSSRRLLFLTRVMRLSSLCPLDAGCHSCP
jgi:hypothetical protein